MSTKQFLFAFAIVLSCVLAVPRAHAQSLEAIKIHFDKPVEVPGQTLPAGTYMFVVPESAENEVQIFNASRTQLLATLQTIPTERAEMTSEIQVKFNEHAGSSAPALLSWFAPGESS